MSRPFIPIENTMSETETRIQEIDLEVDIEESARGLVALHEQLTQTQQRLKEISQALSKVNEHLTDLLAQSDSQALLIIREFQQYAIVNPGDGGFLEVIPVTTGAKMAARLMADSKSPDADNAEA